jgi:ParB-like chromosome segregation protein Spo0J
MKTIELDIEKIVPGKNNPRKTIDEIEEMASSLKKNGQLKPVDVEEYKDGLYFLGDGHRRLLGFQHLLKQGFRMKVNCIVKATITVYDKLCKSI